MYVFKMTKSLYMQEIVGVDGYVWEGVSMERERERCVCLRARMFYVGAFYMWCVFVHCHHFGLCSRYPWCVFLLLHQKVSALQLTRYQHSSFSDPSNHGSIADTSGSQITWTLTFDVTTILGLLRLIRIRFRWTQKETRSVYISYRRLGFSCPHQTCTSTHKQLTWKQADNNLKEWWATMTHRQMTSFTDIFRAGNKIPRDQKINIFTRFGESRAANVMWHNW